ncbi:hypothetical protein XELAEV_18034575mg [Xenopus laevis]|uniref:Uncharacterized protein n=1 Tax=Xenopus laevis TaxID=8355 RepID=A0A974HB92_XENLA|nr:hypothetical protein XELAEV_18034575mg [Xenopus laevis]
MLIQGASANEDRHSGHPRHTPIRPPGNSLCVIYFHLFCSRNPGYRNCIAKLISPLCQQHPGDNRDSCWHSEYTRQITATKLCIF